MESTESNFHLQQIAVLLEKDNPKDLLKYLLINSDAFEEEGIAAVVIRAVSSKMLEIEDSVIESEMN